MMLEIHELYILYMYIGVAHYAQYAYMYIYVQNNPLPHGHFK